MKLSFVNIKEITLNILIIFNLLFLLKTPREQDLRTHERVINCVYSRDCGYYQDLLVKRLLLIRKLLNQEFLVVKLKSSFRKIYGGHHDLVNHYQMSVSQMTTDMFCLS